MKAKKVRAPKQGMTIENCSFSNTNTDDSEARLYIAKALYELAKGIASPSALLVINETKQL